MVSWPASLPLFGVKSNTRSAWALTATSAKITKDQDIGNSYWQEDVMTTIVAHSVINLGTILLVRIANHHADAFGLPRTWRADPRGKFRVRIVCGRHVDHAERLQRPDAIWSGACSSGGDKRRSCTFTLNGGASVTANVQ
jgi:hypothetical protein